MTQQKVLDYAVCPQASALYFFIVVFCQDIHVTIIISELHILLSKKHEAALFFGLLVERVTFR